MRLLYLTLLIISARQLFVVAMSNGEYVDIREVPYMAQIYHQYKYGFVSYCGATIISEYWLVSAAHCVGRKDIEKTQIRVGSSTTLDKGILIDVEKVIVHGDYDTDNKLYDSDICLLKTKTPIEFSEYAQPIPIAREAPKTGDIITISGFGDGHFHIQGVTLRKSNVPVISKEDCIKNFNGKLTDSMFCTNTSLVDLCSGDSGGPAVLNDKLVGVISQGCEYYPIPNIFTTVANFYDWIVKTTGILI